MIDKNKCILIVDDVKDIRESLALILEDEGYIIIQASNGLEALELLSVGQIDMMITDILMPEMDGIELSTQVRNEHPDIKIILISGGGRDVSSEGECDYLGMAKKLTGIAYVLKKPFQPIEMIDLVNQLL